MKKTLTLLTIIAALVLFGTDVHHAQATCAGIGAAQTGIFVYGSTSLDAGQNNLTVSTNGNLSGGPIGDQCQYTGEGDVPYCTWYGFATAVQGGVVQVTGAFSGSIPVSITSAAQQGTGCFDPGEDANFSGSQTFNVSGLANGSYAITLRVTDNDGETDTIDLPFSINRLSVGSCSGSPNPATTGSSMTWSVPTPTGGTGSYTYAWSGTDGLSGTTRTVNKTYSTTGSKNATVTVTSGAQSVPKSCSITVNAPASFDFTVADGGNKSVAPGGQVTNSVTVTKTAGTAASVALTYSGLPSGATASYSPTSCTPNTTCSSTLTINAGTAAVGSYTITVTGTSGATVRTDTFVLTITATNYTLTINKVADPITGDGTNYADVTSVSPDSQISCLGACNSDTGSYASGVSINTNTAITLPGTWVGIGAGSDAACGDPMTMPAHNATCNMVFGLQSAPTCSASPTSGTTGQTIIITAAGGSGGTSPYYTWDTGGGSSCPTGTTCSTSWTTTGTKTVTVTRNGVPGTCTVSIGTPPASPSCTPSPASVATGQTTSISASGGSGGTLPYYTWNTGGGSSCAAGTPCVTSWATQGTKTVTVTRNGVPGTCNVTVGTAPPDEVTALVKINGSSLPQAINFGETATVSWESTGALTCRLTSIPDDINWDQNPAAQNGSKSVSPAVTTEYAASCRNSVNSDSDSNTLTIKPECLPAGQTVSVGQTATLTARGGDGVNYLWSAIGGNPSPSGTGSSFDVSYTTEGTKSVTVQASGTTYVSLPCTVTVTAAPPTTGTIVVNSVDDTTGDPVATKWWLDGPSSQHEMSEQTSKTYLNMPAGNGYVLSHIGIPDGYQSAPTVVPSDTQNLAAGGTITFTIRFTPTPPSTPAVNLLVNGSAGTVEVADNSLGVVSWTTDFVTSCVASSETSGLWSGSKPDDNAGGETVGPITDGVTFILTCKDGKNNDVSDSVLVTVRPPECNDLEYYTGLGKPEKADNDGDGIVDFSDSDGDPRDPGCQSAIDDDEANTAQCKDGIDNDGDNIIDFSGGDPGCSSADDNNELNAEVTECNDGLDNDADGGIDHESVTPKGKTPDVDCESALDPSELKDPDIREI